VISFGAGEPDFDTAERIKDAAPGDAAGPDKYTEVGGTPTAGGVRQVQARQRLAYEPADVLVSCGAKHSLFNWPSRCSTR